MKRVENGFHHALAIDKQRVLWSWGKNNFGQLGQGEDIQNINNLKPQLVQGPLHRVKISEMSCGWQHSLALTMNGFLFSWGLNIFGQLGLGDFIDRYYPEHVKSLSEYKILKVSAGYLHSGAVTDQGHVFTWGHNPDCRLVKKLEYYKKSGRPKNFSSPQFCEAMDQKDIVDISCGTSHTLLLDSIGYVYSAGSPELGQLGTLAYNFIPSKCKLPYILVPGFSVQYPAVKVCAGDGFSVILNQKGEVYSCGKGNFARLGQGDTVSLNVPTKIQHFVQQGILVSDIAVGGRHCLAISNEDSEPDGRAAVYGWGFNFYYQLGMGKEEREDMLVPTKLIVTDKAYRAKHISCGYFNSTVMISHKYCD